MINAALCSLQLIKQNKKTEVLPFFSMFFDVLRVSTVNVWESMVMVQELAGAGERGNREMGMIQGFVRFSRFSMENLHSV